MLRQGKVGEENVEADRLEQDRKKRRTPVSELILLPWKALRVRIKDPLPEGPMAFPNIL